LRASGPHPVRTTVFLPATARGTARPAEVALLPALYAATLFVGATLLFLVQPLVGKLLPPLVGAPPGVGNTCMVFFQAVLLGGSLHAHRSTSKLGGRRQAAAHLILLAFVLLAFKLGTAATGSPVPVISSLLPEDQDYPIF